MKPTVILNIVNDKEVQLVKLNTYYGALAAKKALRANEGTDLTLRGIHGYPLDGSKNEVSKKVIQDIYNTLVAYKSDISADSMYGLSADIKRMKKILGKSLDSIGIWA